MECVTRHLGYHPRPGVKVPSGSHPVCSRMSIFGLQNRMLSNNLALIISIGVTSHPLNILSSNIRFNFHLSTLRQSAEIPLLFCPDGSVIGVMYNVFTTGIDNHGMGAGVPRSIF